jgi:hypothetical protein
MSGEQVRRRTRLELLEERDQTQLVQVRYWDPRVQVWCDYGEPVPAAEADAKRARCAQGLVP